MGQQSGQRRLAAAADPGDRRDAAGNRQAALLLAAVRRGFEMLTSHRVQLRRQLDGDDIDLEAAIEARADVAAGLPMAQRLYRSTRLLQRSLAITLLVDVSGSTDSWVAEQRRIIAVEREALLLVCLTLQSLREPYCVLAFFG